MSALNILYCNEPYILRLWGVTFIKARSFPLTNTKQGCSAVHEGSSRYFQWCYWQRLTNRAILMFFGLFVLGKSLAAQLFRADLSCIMPLHIQPYWRNCCRAQNIALPEDCNYPKCLQLVTLPLQALGIEEGHSTHPCSVPLGWLWGTAFLHGGTEHSTPL